MKVNHNLLGIRILLETAESTSWTLSCHAERDKVFGTCNLFYVYTNQRKEGNKGGGTSYRGLAIMRVDKNGDFKLHADYFTEHLRKGQIHLTRTEQTPPWRFWE